MCEAVKTMSEVANGNYPTNGQVLYEGSGELAAALDDFDASIIINPLVYDEAKHRQTLEESLESIISGAALLADSRYVAGVVELGVHRVHVRLLLPSFLVGGIQKLR